MYEELSKTKALLNAEEFNESMKKIREETEKIELSNVHKLIILFYSTNNKFQFQGPNKYIEKLIKLSDY